ncbi:hypothetical protein BC829DRAFT_420643 [Chytridium lagenaria]|nr:hypothetical protein BC829DRAFT_420643 [Chytridium lagenaria]
METDQPVDDPLPEIDMPTCNDDLPAVDEDDAPETSMDADKPVHAPYIPSEPLDSTLEDDAAAAAESSEAVKKTARHLPNPYFGETVPEEEMGPTQDVRMKAREALVELTKSVREKWDLAEKDVPYDVYHGHAGIALLFLKVFLYDPGFTVNGVSSLTLAHEYIESALTKVHAEILEEQKIGFKTHKCGFMDSARVFTLLQLPTLLDAVMEDGRAGGRRSFSPRFERDRQQSRPRVGAPLAWTWHMESYVGAAHGTAGPLGILMNIPRLLVKAEDEKKEEEVKKEQGKEEVKEEAKADVKEEGNSDKMEVDDGAATTAVPESEAKKEETADKMDVEPSTTPQAADTKPTDSTVINAPTPVNPTVPSKPAYTPASGSNAIGPRGSGPDYASLKRKRFRTSHLLAHSPSSGSGGGTRRNYMKEMNFCSFVMVDQLTKPSTIPPSSTLAKRAAEAVWERGVLRKGVGLCHGISGNAFVFLALYRHTHRALDFHRAQRFLDLAMKFDEPHKIVAPPPALVEAGGRLGRTKKREGLFEGIAGVALLAAEIGYWGRRGRGCWKLQTLRQKDADYLSKVDRSS